MKINVGNLIATLLITGLGSGLLCGAFASGVLWQAGGEAQVPTWVYIWLSISIGLELLALPIAFILED